MRFFAYKSVYTYQSVNALSGFDVFDSIIFGVETQLNI